MKLVSPEKSLLEQHYADLSSKPFFPGLISYMLSGPVCAMVWEGKDVVKTGRGTFLELSLRETVCTNCCVPSHPRCHQPPCLCPRHHPW